MPHDLNSLLVALDRALQEKAPDKAEALAPGAKAAARAKLPKNAPELDVWFAWHDGQRTTTSVSDNRYLLSISEARDAAKFLTREGRGYKPSWFPLFANGGGDYIVYETATGKTRGALVAYWHDDPARATEYPSLAAWAEQMIAGLAKQPKPKKKTTTTAPDLALLEIAIAGPWAVSAKPRKRDAAAAPVGTLYRCEHQPMIAGGAQPVLHVYLKTAPATWVCVHSPLDLAAIPAHVMTVLRAPPKKWGPGYATLDDAAMVKHLVETSLTRWMKLQGKWDVVPHDELFTARATLGARPA